MKIYKRIKFSSIIILLFFCVYILLNSIRPCITIHNDTDTTVYLYTTTSTYGEEPTIEEVDQVKYPKILNPNESYIYKGEIFSFSQKDISFGWRKLDKNGKKISNSSFGVAFLESTKGDLCYVNFSIKENNIGQKKDSFICLRKLRQIRAGVASI